MIRREPLPPLRPYVSALWAESGASSAAACAARERVLPTGATHLVFRLSPEPLLLYDEPAGAPRAVGHAVVGGPRSEAYLRDVSVSAATVGVQLRAGAAGLLFAGSAAELSGAHTPLEQLWGSAAERLREHLADLGDLDDRLDLLERVLLARVPSLRDVHPVIMKSLERVGRGVAIRDVVSDSGYSHRRLLSLFQGAVGLTPKRYARVLRFGRTLPRLAHPGASLTQVALAEGYADQAHFTREFREMAGLSPNAYRALAPRHSHHVPA
ncbi:MAG: helix-turn-helix transcriptional regulator [Polyangiaceae bacterium]|nr:helix-turn-helix transcriptional regulator [Polyangiaceae bacterium]